MKIAHLRERDNEKQSVDDHLIGVADLCGEFTAKIGLQSVGELLGLLHDLGKYSDKFQNYIQSATGLLVEGVDDNFVDAKALKGKIDHATAGAQWVWQQFSKYGVQGQFVGQIIAVGLASHHGGMLDCLKPDGENGFKRRINKNNADTHLLECLDRIGDEVFVNITKLASKDLLTSFYKLLHEIVNSPNNHSDLAKSFKFGFLSRFLFSCLVDADRIDTADFENPGNARLRSMVSVDWQVAIDRLEKRLQAFPVRNKIDSIRCDISDQCRQRADDKQGTYTLTVPTGGGKTYTSIRYALHHAKKHNLDRIIYIIPFTSIIDQNAAVIRDVIEQDGDEFPWVLEHHSNLEPEEQTPRSKIITENWDSPIIFTTMVQFLEVLFGGGTRGARRMHTLASSVLIFDEIQSLPINCVHLFCNALQFFVDHTKTTAVLCTATQPLLDRLQAPEKGQLHIPEGNELVDDMNKVFAELKRVEVVNKVRLDCGWSADEICQLAVEQLKTKGNCLVIVNTKKWAQLLHDKCSNEIEVDSLFHLSTSLCPAHRQIILAEVRTRLDKGLPVLCISTQLIEAGVDVDFNAVIRFLAGLDSIAQAAGRCNRNGNHTTSQVLVVNPDDEAIDMLDDIKIGREKSLRIFSEYKDGELLDPEVMRQYFAYYFYERADLMTYPLTVKQAGRENDTLLNLLSDNKFNVGRDPASPIKLQQSFKTAGKVFKAIDAPTQAVVVQYGKGRDIVAELCGVFEPAKAYTLLKQAQKYSVNVFPNVWRQLTEANAVFQIQGEEIYYLDERYYSKDFGLSIEEVSDLAPLIEGGV